MILNSAPQNEAVLSNVGEIGEFRIRNSAKAFGILSSGLYANKIRAIVRELSCNAVDSHVAAGKQATPFDVHLPNTLEPHFSIRDYGTGLTHEQVSQIYTTYFESTKTGSNDFIGALGLGSKTPFSYTDNFTVTAIKDGRKGIYSAFINATGVPSIALMMTEETDEPAGVEIKFSVNDRYDFNKFAQEASSVFTYFAVQPVVSGYSGFSVNKVNYSDKDIVPGVHSTTSRYTVAVMGHIAYPVSIPESGLKEMGEVASLLNCGLEMHFAIGELDFQASREGLSYIPETVAAIKRKLELVNAQLSVHIAAEADKIENQWDRAIFLSKKKDSGLWSAAVIKYVVDTKFELLVNQAGYGSWRTKTFALDVAEIASQYNVVVRSFGKNRNGGTVSNHTPSNTYPDPADRSKVTQVWNLTVSDSMFFVKNDTKVGAAERAKFHWKTTKWADTLPYSMTVVVLDAVDKTKPANFDAFLKMMANPPRVMLASSLNQKERKTSGSTGKNVTIMQLVKRDDHYRQRNSDDFVWRDAGKADAFDKTVNFYYLPLSGYTATSKIAGFDVKVFMNDIKDCGIAGASVAVYGVRKGDIEFIKTQKNWVNVEEHLIAILSKVSKAQLVNLAIGDVDNYGYLHYNNTYKTIALVTNNNSPYKVFGEKYKFSSKASYSAYSLNRLCRNYGTTVNVEVVKAEVNLDCTNVFDCYPLLKSLGNCNNSVAIAEYINLIDTKKGI